MIETYYSIIYGNWYVLLTAEDPEHGRLSAAGGIRLGRKRSFGCCLEDINGDGTPELFLGIDNTGVQRSGVYQLFTVNKGQPGCLYTATGEDAVYLLKDGLLEYELWGSDDSYAMCVYRLAKNGGVSMTEGVLYDKNAKKRPYFSISEQLQRREGRARQRQREDALRRQGQNGQLRSAGQYRRGRESVLYPSDDGGQYHRRQNGQHPCPVRVAVEYSVDWNHRHDEPASRPWR